MKVTLEVQGGIAGGIPLPPVVVDSDRLPPGEAAELAGLVAAAKAEQTVKRDGPLREKIKIEDGGQTVVLDQLVTAMSPAFAALRRWLKAHSGAKA